MLPGRHGPLSVGRHGLPVLCGEHDVPRCLSAYDGSPSGGLSAAEYSNHHQRGPPTSPSPFDSVVTSIEPHSKPHCLFPIRDGLIIPCPNCQKPKWSRGKFATACP